MIIIYNYLWLQSGPHSEAEIKLPIATGEPPVWLSKEDRRLRDNI